MDCPRCKNRKTEVTDTRKSSNKATRRRRKCIKCTNIFYTVEVFESAIADVVLENKLSKIKNEFTRLSTSISNIEEALK